MKYKIEAAGGDFIYHWIVYMIGALNEVDLSSKIDVCFDTTYYTSYQLETFDILSDVIRVVPTDNQFQLIPSIKPIDATNGSGINHVNPSTYFFLRDLFLTRVDEYDTSAYEKIYIRRNRSHLCEGNVADNSVKRRQIVNEDELVKHLEPLGIKCINFEDYTLSQKIKIFNNAKLVIAPQSGGLVFSLFANKNTNIIEIYPPKPYQYCDQYLDICKVLGISFDRYFDVTKVDRNDNMTIQSEKFVQYLLNKKN